MYAKYIGESISLADMLPGNETIEIVNEISKYGWDADTALAIATCESGLNKRAYNPELIAKKLGVTKFSSCGIFQINSSECYKENSPLYNWQYNISKAYEKYLRQGWEAWKRCSKKIKYQ